MQITKCVNPNDEQKKDIYRLWNNEYPAQLGYQRFSDLELYLANLKNPVHYFLVDDDGNAIGWAFVFERDGERWFAIIVDGSMHKKGLGSLLLNMLKENEQILNGWATDHNKYVTQDGRLYPSPVAFYLKNGFSTCDEIRLEIEKLSAVKIRWARTTTD